MPKYVGREFYAAIVSTFLAKKESNNDDDSVDYVESTKNDKGPLLLPSTFCQHRLVRHFFNCWLSISASTSLLNSSFDRLLSTSAASIALSL